MEAVIEGRQQAKYKHNLPKWSTSSESVVHNSCLGRDWIPGPKLPSPLYINSEQGGTVCHVIYTFSPY